MKTNNIQLSIKDIVLLKHDPYNYYITKTHDGTSSGPLRDPIIKVIRASTQTTYRYTEAYSNDGKTKIWDTLQSDYAESRDWNLELTDIDHSEPTLLEITSIQQDTKGQKDMHIISKPTYDEMQEPEHRNISFYDKNGEKYTLPLESEALRLTMQDEDGDYIARSQTTIGEDATSVTFIKNNKFNPENHEKYEQLIDHMAEDLEAHASNREERAREIFNDSVDWDRYTALDRNNRKEMEEWNDYLRKMEINSRKKAGEELGDTKTYINEVYAPLFEEQNVKIKFGSYNERTKHDGEGYRTGDLYDVGDYEKDWENHYEKEFMTNAPLGWDEGWDN